MPAACDPGQARDDVGRAHNPSMERDEEPEAVEPAPDSQRFRRLPERVRLEDTVETHDTTVARDPEGGRDTDRDFMIRYSGG